MDAHGPNEEGCVAEARQPSVSSPGEATTFRDLSPRWSRLSTWIANVIGALILPMMFILAYALARQHHYGLPFVLTAILVPGWLSVLVVHEGGHWWVARRRAMTVTQVVIGPVEIQPRRRGVRIRLHRNRQRGVGGYVMAYPDPGRDMRRDLIALALGGPLANLAAALVLAVLAWWLGHSFAQAWCLLLGLLHLLAALFNLLPRSLNGAMVSDGLNVLRAYVNRVEDLPGATFMAINGRLLRGESAGDLPEALIRRLGEEPAPMPALHDWLTVYLALGAHELDAAEAALETLHARIDAYEEPIRQALGDLLIITQADCVFARALDRRGAEDLAAIAALDLDARGFWHAPQLAPRVRALAAALRGDSMAAREQLLRSRRHADNSAFASTVASEAGLRECIEAIIDEADIADGTAPARAPGAITQDASA
ncbi:site-2 protease family protein [Lysobacter capsici]|uniref:site-2 protease family protein n=1 Tax=Lysobacter capsici TaxID=435897 RepID=UPI001C002469|nr:site-2 protease family protein [Lysobacter capsici]QWF15004.1 site-2 protease family protein [Lysobacter capsici]